MEGTYHNLFIFDDHNNDRFLKFMPLGWVATIRSCFILKKELPNRPGIYNNNTVIFEPVNKKKATTIAVAGLILFALAIAVTALAALALFFPPVGAAIGGLVALSTVQLGAIGGIALFLGLIGLTFGAAAARTLHRVAIDDDALELIS